MRIPVPQGEHFIIRRLRFAPLAGKHDCYKPAQKKGATGALFFYRLIVNFYLTTTFTTLEPFFTITTPLGAARI
jgi:hypothetical protein